MMQTPQHVMARLFYVVLLCVVIILGYVTRATPGHWSPGSPYKGQAVGYDVSWPNCEAKPLKNVYWGVVGVTGGLSLRPNPCLKQEAGWFTSYTLYANSGYPGPERAQKVTHGPRDCSSYDEVCVAYNYGYAEGVYAVSLATKQGLHSAMWWIDVEIDNSWSDYAVVNRASLQGTYDAIKHETVIATVGYYSYPAQWDLITGEWRNGQPAWAATGELTKHAADLACTAPSFTGGPLWLGQYTDGFDRNVPCPETR